MESMEVSILNLVVFCQSRIMAYACLRNVFPKLEFYDSGRQSMVRSDGKQAKPVISQCHLFVMVLMH